MAKLGENTPHIIDATVDFMASSQAFREYLKKLPPDNTIPPALTDELFIPTPFRRVNLPRQPGLIPWRSPSARLTVCMPEHRRLIFLDWRTFASG